MVYLLNGMIAGLECILGIFVYYRDILLEFLTSKDKTKVCTWRLEVSYNFGGYI
jgi:hypothetical protein